MRIEIRTADKIFAGPFYQMRYVVQGFLILLQLSLYVYERILSFACCAVKRSMYD